MALPTEERSVLPEFNLLSELKHRFHCSIKAGVWHLQHDGILGAFATDILVDRLNHKLDSKDADWIRWADFEDLATPSRVLSWIGRMRRVPALGWLANRLLAHRLGTQHDLAFGFLSVHQHLVHEVENWTGDEKMLALLHQITQDNLEGAREALIDLHQLLPEVCIDANTRQAARLMLNAARRQVKDMEAQGVLPKMQANMMVAQVETQAAAPLLGQPASSTPAGLPAPP
jgi:hypothetical protein